MVFAKPHGDAVIGEETQFVHHQAIAAFAHLEGGEHVGVHAVKKLRRIRTLDLDLAKGGGIQQPHFVAHRENLTVDGTMLVFTGTRIGVSPPPLANRFERGAPFHMPLVDGCAADGQEQVFGENARNGAK